MPIDSFTVLLFGLFIKLVLGGLFVVFWWKNRSAPWFGWWYDKRWCWRWEASGLVCSLRGR